MRLQLLTERRHRAVKANDLINTIASCGRMFFRYKDVASFHVCKHGRVWFRDAYSKQLIYTHYAGRWRRFSEGGTMKNLVKSLATYIMYGTYINPHIFGPWPDWYCNGDLWGYGNDIEKVRIASRRLGIVTL